MGRVIKCWSNSPLPSIWEEEPQVVPLARFRAGYRLSWRGDATTPNAGIKQLSQLEGEGVWLPGPFSAGMRELGVSPPWSPAAPAGPLTHFKTHNKSNLLWSDKSSPGLSPPWFQ